MATQHKFDYLSAFYNIDTKILKPLKVLGSSITAHSFVVKQNFILGARF